VTGSTVASSYFGANPGKDSFTPDGWLRTGDVGVIDADGCVHVVDRLKDLIKSGGEWIGSVELENAIMEHTDVYEAAVIA
ncbi:AMP-binding protein, partial [Escherichia coli]